MIIPIILAVWLGFRARHLGRNTARWALIGFFLPILINTLVVNSLAFVLSERIVESADESYLVAIVVVGALAGIVTTIVVGRTALKPQEYHRFEAASRSGPSEESESSTWSADEAREETHAETADRGRVR